MLKKIIIPIGYGQTCNQLLQIAHWIPAAIEFDIPLYFPCFKKYRNMFYGTINQRHPRFPRYSPKLDIVDQSLSFICKSTAQIQLINSALYKIMDRVPGIVSYHLNDNGRDGNKTPTNVLENPRIAAGKSLFVRGWLYRDKVGVEKHSEAIKNYFKPVIEIQDRIDSCIQKNNTWKSVLVGVHIRRGDYSKWSDGRYYYDDSTICSMMNQITRLLPENHVRFLLVSNEIIDLKNYNAFDVFTGPGDPAGDLYSLAACNYIIGPPSTYTIWASFYGNVPLYVINNKLDYINIEVFSVFKGL